MATNTFGMGLAVIITIPVGIILTAHSFITMEQVTTTGMAQEDTIPNLYGY